MARIPQKTPFRCPGCGFSQMEPPHLISTYCRSCGGHYEVAGSAISEAALPPLPHLRTDANRRSIFCHKCGSSHPVSSHARSTLCPCCNASIDLADVTFHSPASLRVDTRGKLLIGPEASLSSSLTICGSAHIQGRIIGRLVSEGEVRIGTNEVCACDITAPVIVIEKNKRPTFTYPLRTERLVVFGCLTGIVHCRGVVHVRRGGRLEAEIHAKAVTVDKGGILLGDCRVSGNSTKPAITGDAWPAGWPDSLCIAQ